MSKILGKSHDRWCTPPEFYAVLDNEFNFGLDAAASDENHLAPAWITEEEDALMTEWTKAMVVGDRYADHAVYCNPPYSMIGKFVKRGYEQSELYVGLTVVMLIPTYSDPKYWRDYVCKAHEVRNLVGRLAFIDEDGKKKQSARFPSTVVVFKKILGNHYGKSPNIWSWDWKAVYRK